MLPVPCITSLSEELSADVYSQMIRIGTILWNVYVISSARRKLHALLGCWFQIMPIFYFKPAKLPLPWLWAVCWPAMRFLITTSTGGKDICFKAVGWALPAEGPWLWLKQISDSVIIYTGDRSRATLDTRQTPAHSQGPQSMVLLGGQKIGFQCSRTI